MLALFVQGLAISAPSGMAGRSVPFEHLMLHAQAAEHHHHDDHSLHIEDRGDSAQHSHIDVGACSFILPTSTTADVVPVNAVRLSAEPADLPRPVLDGPYKPPRSA